ncbi:hypothetical protein [Paraherbaspirillum soli]|uniref:Uncharacterized protein n=1 Tax=Paraherbaspirillum soli TaxID=631222 RepID=A0ABW0MBQ8_9BURK
MAALSEYANVQDTALKILLKKGYQFWFDDRTELYCAEKNGWDFKAESPCGLLGIVTIYEFKNPGQYSEYWWKEEGENVFRNISHEQPAYVPIWKKT